MWWQCLPHKMWHSDKSLKLVDKNNRDTLRYVTRVDAMNGMHYRGFNIWEGAEVCEVSHLKKTNF